jgi:Na+-transporting methylmalonyl-CoA/oxaloacetate decarboxylase gamma subunit
MVNRTATAIRTHLPRVALFLVLLVVLVQVMPRALGQSFDRGSDEALISQKEEEIGVDRSTPTATSSKRTSEAQLPAALSESIHQSEAATHAQLPSAPPIQDAPGVANCNTEPGIVIHDDGTIENGYSGNPVAGINQVRFVDRFTPTAYPASFSSVCIAHLTQSGGPPSWPVNLVIYDDDGPGGGPGRELGHMAVTAQNTFFPNPTPGWNSYDISWMNLFVDSGSVYIGVRWMTTSPNVFMAGDESADRPAGFAGGHWWNNVANAWAPIESAFPNYRSLLCARWKPIRPVRVRNGSRCWQRRLRATNRLYRQCEPAGGRHHASRQRFHCKRRPCE